jgi:hypothetical protein
MFAVLPSKDNGYPMANTMSDSIITEIQHLIIMLIVENNDFVQRELRTP